MDAPLQSMDYNVQLRLPSATRGCIIWESKHKVQRKKNWKTFI